MSRFRDTIAEDDAESGIDISPLIDCVFILLIFFIVTTVFVEETGVEVARPQAATSEQLKKNSILIAITAEGDVVYGGRNIGIPGVQPMVKRLLQDEAEIPVIIQADRNAPSELLVRVVGEAKLANARTVNVATRAGEG